MTQPTPSSPSWSSLDLRSLSLLRIALGSLVIATVLTRWSLLELLYSDRGLLPRLSYLQVPLLQDLWWCFHLGTGSLLGQQALALILLMSAFFLLVGWRSRLACWTCWVFLASLQARNPFAHDRGDLELLLFLFWAGFLPLGEFWSLESREAQDRPASLRVRGWPSAALITQLGLVYLFAGLTKYGEFWLVRGDGFYYSLQSPLFATPLALWLAEKVPLPLLQAANYAAISLELFLALLILSPWAVPQSRTLATLLAVVFHLGVGAMFQLGLFPLIGAMMALALIPTEAWNRLPPKLQRFVSQASSGSSRTARPPPPACALLIFALFLALWSNLHSTWPNVFSNSTLSRAARALRVEQSWVLFSPLPPYLGQFQLQAEVGPDRWETVAGFPPSELHGGDEPYPQFRFLSHPERMLYIASLFPSGSALRESLAEHARNSYAPSLKGEYRLVFSVYPVGPDGSLTGPETWHLTRRVSSIAE